MKGTNFQIEQLDTTQRQTIILQMNVLASYHAVKTNYVNSFRYVRSA